ncbi:MAG: glycosyltransferase [Richelia sp. CSU_2_1]|nr:glycosyltransferase [Richelia sp. CSU_2_1]
MTQQILLEKLQYNPLVTTLGIREQYRDRYWETKDPICSDRLLWRAQTFRHIVHLLPGQTILEIGCGKGFFTKQLARVSRGENPITAVTFNSENDRSADLPDAVEFLTAVDFPGELAGRQFDFIVAMDLLDKGNCGWVLQKVYELLKPGGQVIFYETNPWNLVHKIRRRVSKYLGKQDPRKLLARPELYELISEVGFIKVFAIFNDFVYAPLTREMIWILRNLSIILENTPVLQTLAGSILVHAQKPPRNVDRPLVSLCDREELRGAISVVVPCHNEEMNIEPLVSRLMGFYGDYIHEIVLVDDNSKDGTSEVMKKLASENSRIKPVFRTPPNGVGRAIADGYKAATGRYILSMDCDFQHLLPEMRELFDAAVGHDVVIGSRFSRHSVLLNYPLPKIVVNRGFHLLAQIVLFRRFRDLTNNLKIMRREVVEQLELTQPGFGINAETGLQPLLKGFTVKEVPISWIDRTPDMGVSSFRLVRVGGGYVQVLWKLWLQNVLGIGKS